MKRVFGYIILVIILVSGQSVMAQNLKFGHINSEELFAIMPERDSVVTKLELVRTDLQNNLELMNVEFNNKYKDYVDNQAKMTALVRQTKEQELSELQTRIQNFQNAASQQFEEERMTLLEPIYTKIEKAIKDVAKENSFTYVFDTSKGVLLYFDETKSQNLLALVKTKLGIK